LKNVLYKSCKVLKDALNSSIRSLHGPKWHHHGQIKVILNFSNGTPYFLFYVLVADVETFPKHW